MTTTINANTTAGLVYSADTSGIIKVQSNGVATNALAWVNFNGSGTVAIRSAYNVSSITDNGTGDYTINFTTAMSDANYAAQLTGGDFSTTGGDNPAVYTSATTAPTTSSLRINTMNGGPVNGAYFVDLNRVSVAIFGN